MRPSPDTQSQDERLSLRQQVEGWRQILLESLHETPPRSIVEVFVVIATATLLMLPFREQLGVLNVLLIFLLLTFALALTRGLWPAALCAVLGFIAFQEDSLTRRKIDEVFIQIGIFENFINIELHHGKPI